MQEQVETQEQLSEASVASVPGAAAAGTDGRLHKFWKAAIQLEASDLVVRPGVAVKFRIKGQLKNADAEPFSHEEMEREVRNLLSEDQWRTYEQYGSVDLSYAYDADNRFRVNVFQTMGRPAVSARRISSDILGYAALNLPASLATVAEAHQGLVLLCGITGSGKSTTIAAMIQQINETRSCHVVTIEDPVEFVFKDAKALINQREIGLDVPDFTVALKAMVRENPDVVLIGELRDRETFEAAVRAAETGHLVFGTIHASSVDQTFGRIYNLFPKEERDLIRDMFASNLKALVYQKLLPTLRSDVPRVPAVEVMISNPSVRKYIREGREAELPTVIRRGRDEGMIDYHDWLVELINREYIHPRVALEAARNPDELKMRMKGIKTSDQ